MQALGVVDELRQQSRSYRVLHLENQMRVVIISDPASTLSAASMSVRVGSFMDPENVPGLAHLLEHVLFLGTEKYPKNGEFRTFLGERGGATNADTSSTVSTFHYYVGSDHAEEALKRFADFFRAPLLSAETIEGEVEIVHSEYESMLYSDAHRQLQVMRCTSSEKHPFSRILIGTRDTLLHDEENLQARLSSFFNLHYSSNLMNLAVLSSQPLDVMQSWIKDYFSILPNYKLPLHRSMPHRAFDSATCLMKLYRIRSVQGYRNLSLMFEIDNDGLSNSKIQTNNIIAALLTKQSRFPYLKKLRAKGWASNYTVVPFEGSSFLQFIVILTDLGVSKIEDVILLTFQYINIVTMSNEREIGAAFQEALQDHPDLPNSYPEELCQYFSNTMAEMAVVGKNLLSEPITTPECMKQVRDALRQLRPDTSRIDFLYPWKEPGDRPVQVLREPFYRTEYSVGSLSDRLVKKLGKLDHDRRLRLWTLRPNAKLSFPFWKANNRFRSANQDVLSNLIESVRHGSMDCRPQLLVSDAVVDLWHCHQEQSSTNISLMFQSMAIFDCQTFTLLRLFVKTVNLMISQSFERKATDAGFKIDITVSGSPGFNVHCSGNTEKIGLLIQAIVKVLDLCKNPKKKAYKRALKALINEVTSSEDRSIIAISERQLLECTADFVYSKQTELNILPMLSFNTFAKFTRNLFITGHWTVLATGGISPNNAIEITASFTNITSSGRAFEPRRLTALPTDRISVVNHFVTNGDRNSVATVYFQLADSNESYHCKAIALVLTQLLAAPIFEQLRTTEKLGYIVQSRPQLLHGVIGLLITVQSERFSPDYIHQRIDHFFNNIELFFSELSHGALHNTKKAAADGIEYCHESIWKSVEDHSPVCALDEITNHIAEVSRDDLEQFCIRRLCPNGSERRQLLSMVYGYGHQLETKLKNAIYVNDPHLFRKLHPVFQHQSAMAA